MLPSKNLRNAWLQKIDCFDPCFDRRDFILSHYNSFYGSKTETSTLKTAFKTFRQGLSSVRKFKVSLKI